MTDWRPLPSVSCRAAPCRWWVCRLDVPLAAVGGPGGSGQSLHDVAQLAVVCYPPRAWVVLVQSGVLQTIRLGMQKELRQKV